MDAHQLKMESERCRYEYENCKANFNEAFSEEAKEAFLANPKSVWFQYDEGQTRKEGLTEQWNDEKRRFTASLERKAKRLDVAETAYARECWFQSEHAYVNTVIDGKILCGSYKVFRILSSDDGRPKHFEFVLKRSPILGDEIPAKVIVPLGTMMGVGAWSDVTLSKITMKEEGHHDDHLCHHCRCELSECPEGGDHGDAFRSFAAY
jgi:hypothetical protein